MLTSPTSPKASAMFSKVSAIVSPLSPGNHHSLSLVCSSYHQNRRFSIVMIIMIVCSKHCQINGIWDDIMIMNPDKAFLPLLLRRHSTLLTPQQSPPPAGVKTLKKSLLSLAIWQNFTTGGKWIKSRKYVFQVLFSDTFSRFTFSDLRHIVNCICKTFCGISQLINNIRN